MTSTPPIRGWWVTFAAGFVPLMAGIATLVTFWSGAAHPNASLWTGLGRLDFAYAELSSVSAEAAAWLELLGSVGGVNVVAAAVAVIVVSRFALRHGSRWAWWFLAFCLLWVGGHDAIVATRFFLVTGEPIVVMPYTYVVVMTAGLIRTRSAVFGEVTRA